MNKFFGSIFTFTLVCFFSALSTPSNAAIRDTEQTEQSSQIIESTSVQTNSETRANSVVTSGQLAEDQKVEETHKSCNARCDREYDSCVQAKEYFCSWNRFWCKYNCPSFDPTESPIIRSSSVNSSQQ